MYFAKTNNLLSFIFISILKIYPHNDDVKETGSLISVANHIDICLLWGCHYSILRFKKILKLVLLLILKGKKIEAALY